MNEMFHRLTVPVVDKFGVYLRYQRYYNTPLSALYPELLTGEKDADGFAIAKMVIIDWRGHCKPGERPIRPTEEEFWAGVTYQGQTYRPYTWGSGIKEWRTLGLTSDVLVNDGLVQNVEQSVYGTRHLLASNGGFYGATQGHFRVGIVPHGTRIPGTHIVVADGHGAVKRSVVKLNAHSPVRYGRMRPSYQLAQWINLKDPGVWDEIEALIDETFMRAIDLNTFSPVEFALSHGYLSEEKERWAKLDPDMVLHPIITGTAAKATKDLWFRLATAIPFCAENKLLIPIEDHQVVWPGHHGQALGFRYPLDCPDDPEWENYLRDLEVIQHTLASRDFFAKGLMSIVDDFGPEYDQYDVLVCAKDIKMAHPAAFDVESLGQVKELFGAEIDGVLCAVQRYAKGSCMGVDADWAAKALGADVDGDTMGMVDATELPAIFQSVKDSKPFPTKKVQKTVTPISLNDRRPELGVTNMRNIVGQASNELSSALAIGDENRVAHDLGFEQADTMLTMLNRCVKYGTDGFKSLLDMDETERMLFTFGGHYTNKYGSKPPFLQWAKDNTSFVTSVPKIGWDSAWSKEERAACLTNTFQGSVAQIARYTIPAIEKVYQKAVLAKPLAYFQAWAAPAPGLERQAKDLQFWFNNKRAAMGEEMENGDRVAGFKRECQAYASDYCTEQKLDRWTLANELWIITHSGDTSGAAVFYFFPQEAERIVTEKPGSKSKVSATIKTKVLGLHYQIPNPPASLELNVEVLEHHKIVKNRELVQTVICGRFPHQVQPSGYPQDMLAVVDSKSIQPQPGHYRAGLKKIEGSAYAVELVKKSETEAATSVSMPVE